jgi:hypothetical protein
MIICSHFNYNSTWLMITMVKRAKQTLRPTLDFLSIESALKQIADNNVYMAKSGISTGPDLPQVN